MRKITLLEIEAIEFKNHKTFKQAFGAVNKITGSNGEGKSSIFEMVTWTLGGVDMLGSKLDPTPTDRVTDRTFSSVLLDLDGKPIKFGHELVKGKHVYYINDVPTKATEYTELEKSITGYGFEFLLCLMNPSYFPTMHWNDQRNMLFSFVSPPAAADVLKELPKLQADKLKEAFKKLTADQLESFHKKNKTDKEKESIAAKSRVETLEGQMKSEPNASLEELQKQLSQAVAEFEAAETELNAIQGLRIKYNQLSQRSTNLLSAAEHFKHQHSTTKQSAACIACSQELSEDKKKVLLSEINTEYKKAVQEYKAVLEEMKSIIIPDSIYDYQEINARRISLIAAVGSEERRLEAVKVIDEAKKKQVEVLASLTDSIFLLDALKAFRAEEAKQQADKVKSLFTGITIILEDHLGKPTFSIAMNGKPYVKLSLGEKVKAGLELISVISQQSEILAPTLIDNAESVTSQMVVEHQSIAAYAKGIEYDKDVNMTYDGKLKIETDLDKNKIIVDCEVL